MLSQRDTALLVAAQIRQAQSSVRDLFTDARQSIRESLMSPEELYNSRRSQISARVGHLSIASDPALISRLSQEITSLTNTAFNSLDANQKAQSGDEFLQFLIKAQDFAAEGLADATREVENGVTQIDGAFNASADRLIQSANVQQQAAQTFAAGVEEFGAGVEQLSVFASRMALLTGGDEVNI